MKILRQGSRIQLVALLQRFLNKKGVAPPLKEDAIFGPKTHVAVLWFQGREHISKDGIVGPVTWNRLGITIDITHRVTLIPQPTAMSCWAAAAAMVLGNMSVGPGPAALGGGGGLLPGPNNIKSFADSLGWTMHYPQSWPINSLQQLLSRGPVWAVGGGTAGGGFLHAVVLSALWSDGVSDGSGTMVRIHDPWPVNRGSIYARFYRGTIEGTTPYGTQFDFLSMYILEPR